MTDKVYGLINNKIHGTAVNRYVGKPGDIFYDPAIGDLRLSDGITPGGLSANGGNEPQIWVAQADSTYAYSNAQAICYDSNGNIFSLMYQGPYTEANSVASIAKFSPEGNVIWTKDLKTGTSINPWSLAVDHQDNVYIIVQQQNNEIWNNTVVKMSGETGSITWQVDIQDSQYSNNMQALPVYSEGFIGVAVIGTAYNGNDRDFFVGFIAEDGTNYGVSNFGDAWNQSAYGAAVNPNGDIVIAGITQSSGPNYMEVIKLSYGGIAWQNSYTVDESYNLFAADVAWSSYDSTWVVAGTHDLQNGGQGLVTAKLYDYDGSVTWAHEIANGCTNIASSIATDADGYIYISGSTYSGKNIQNGAPGLWRILGAYDSEGNKVWQKYFRGSESSWVIDNNWWNETGSTGKAIAVYGGNMAIAAISANWVDNNIQTEVGLISQFPKFGIDQSIGFYELRQSFLTDSPINLGYNGTSFEWNQSSATLVASTTVESVKSAMTYYVNHAGSSLNKLINGGKSVILGADGQTSFPGEVVDPVGNVRSIPRRAVIDGNDHDLTLVDNGQFLYGANGTIYVPTNANTQLPVGYTVTIITNENNNLRVYSMDSNITRILAPGVGYTNGYSIPSTSMATLIKVDVDTWYLSGYGVSQD